MAAELVDYDTAEGIARTQPHDIAAERAVLGMVMSNPAQLDTARALVHDGKAFYRPAHELIWRAIDNLATAGEPCDPVAVTAHLRRTGGLAAIDNNPLYLSDLVADRPAGSVTYLARAVDEAYRRRQIIEESARDIQHAYDPTTPVDLVEVERLDRIEQHAQRLIRSTEGTSWASIDLTPVLAGQQLLPPPDICYRTDGHALLYAGRIHLLAGEPESGKSWLALVAALQTMQAGHTVTYIDFEDEPASVAGRLLALGARPEWLAGAIARFRYMRPNDSIDGDTDALRDLDRAATGAALVILDGVTEVMTMHGLDPLGNSDIARFYVLLPRRIKALGPAVVMIDHVTKDSESRGRWAFGGQHKLAGVDVMYQVKAITPFAPGQLGRSRVTISKDRPGHVRANSIGAKVAADFMLDSREPNIAIPTLEPVSQLPRDNEGEQLYTIYMERISRWLEIRPGASGSDIEKAKLGKVEYVRKALSALIRLDNVAQDPGRNGGYSYRVERPYRDGSGEDEEVLPWDET